MKRSPAFALFAVTLAFLGGCATGPQINHDLSPEVDLSGFETFALMPLPKRVEGAQPDANQRYGRAAQEAMRDALLAKGYTEAASLEEADFALNLKAAISPTLNVAQWGYTTGNYAGTDYWGTSSYYEVVADVDVRPKDHALVLLEIYENKEKTLAWCSWIIEPTRANRMTADEVKLLLTKMLASFPAN